MRQASTTRDQRVTAYVDKTVAAALAAFADAEGRSISGLVARIVRDAINDRTPAAHEGSAKLGEGTADHAQE